MMRCPSALLLGLALALLGPLPAQAALAAERLAPCPRVGPRAPGTWLPPRTLRSRIAGPWASGQVHVYLPRGYRAGGDHPLVIALHGWDSPVGDWWRRSGIAAHADRIGAVVAAPAMGRTVYETEYLGARRDPRADRTPAVPGARWIGEVVLPHLRRCLAVSPRPGRTAILGYSTGGRGAVVVAQHYREFGLVAGLSGTYDLEALTPGTGEYRIHAMFFGERAANLERWRREQSVSRALVEKLVGVLVLLGHGKQDRVVSSEQTVAMGRALHAAKLVPAPEVRIDPDAAHDWAFWKPQVAEALRRFEALLARPAPAPPRVDSPRPRI